MTTAVGDARGGGPDDAVALRILATAMAGRAVEVADAEPGRRTWTDGRTIHLELDVGPGERLALLATQASLLAGGGLDAPILSDLGRSRSLASRYLAVEGQRALVANEAFLPSRLRRLADHQLAGTVSSPTESLALARDDRTLEPAWVLGTLDPRRITPTDHAEGLDVATGPSDLESPVDLDALDELDEDDDTGLDLGNMLSSPVGGGGPIGKLLAKLLRSSRSRDGSGDPGGDAPTHVGRGRPTAGRPPVRGVAGGSAIEGDVSSPESACVYPEWDEAIGAYQPGWCHVVQSVADPADDELRPVAEAAPMRRSLARLGLGLTPVRRQREGDDLDIDAVVEARVDHLAGAPHEDDVYVESLRRRRDLSVVVLLDVSGSAAEAGVGGLAVHDHQRRAALALTTALHDLGDRVALHAFNSRGRKAVQVAEVKAFDGPLDAAAAGRLSGLRPGAYTRLGAAIRHGTALLDRAGGTPRRLLVVLSDGFAYDHGYQGRHGEADARRALLEARHAGIGCLCLSVGAADTDVAALRRVFGAAAHAAVPSTAHLPAHIGPLFASALASADAQRRTFVRTERTRERLEIERGRR